MQRGKGKKRSVSCYERKKKRITDWYNHIVEEREKNKNEINPNTKNITVKKELKPLSFYIDQIKKPSGGN